MVRLTAEEEDIDYYMYVCLLVTQEKSIRVCITVFSSLGIQEEERIVCSEGELIVTLNT